MHASMSPGHSKPSEPRRLDAVERQAAAWVRQLAGGRMTRAEGEALKQWCREDEAHARAFALARRRWDRLGEAAREVAATTRHSPVAAPACRSAGRRRLLLGGMAAGATAAGVAVLAWRPPLGLWPSMDELAADYRTATGEQRRVVLADAVAVQLNTRTSISVRPAVDGQAAGIDLITGEAAVDLSRSQEWFAVQAGVGRAEARGARFEVRRLDGSVCVRCLDGQMRVVHAAGETALTERQQVRYDQAGLGPLERFDPEIASAWRDGFLRFVDTPLGEVINEINRYRPGRLVLLDQAMSARPVTGRFRLDALDVAVGQIRESFGLGARTLPGGVLLLS